MYSADELPLEEVDYEEWGRGLRNPFRAATHTPTGDIYIGDVGDIAVEVSEAGYEQPVACSQSLY